MTVLTRRAQPLRFEVRSIGTDVRLLGYASVFNAPYRVNDSHGSFSERIAPGAFAQTLSTRPDVRLLIDHSGQPLARTKSGTLRLSEDSHGLRVEATLDPSDPDVQRLLPKMRRGDLDQMSFAFRVPAGGDAWNDSYTERTIRRTELDGGDVSVVTYPASPSTTVALEALSARAQARLKAPYTLAEVLRAQREMGR